MNAEELKRKLKDLFGDQIVFNKEFDRYVGKIKNIEANLLQWCILLKERKIRPIFPVKLKDGVVFIKKIGSSNRCIVIKIVNGEFKEVFITKSYYNYRVNISIKECTLSFYF